MLTRLLPAVLIAAPVLTGKRVEVGYEQSTTYAVLDVDLPGGGGSRLRPLVSAPASAFLANWVFNSLILVVLLIGVGITIRQVLILEPELNWIKVFRTGQTGLSVAEEPRLLKPLARNLSSHVNKDRFSMSALSLRTVLDGIRTRLDESREISHYMVGLLVFLGLLGTFWGLLGTIQAVGSVISSLEVGGQGNFAAVFTELKQG